VGLSPRSLVLAGAAAWHTPGAVLVALGAGQGAMSQRVGARSGICTHALVLCHRFWVWKNGTKGCGSPHRPPTHPPPKFLSNGEGERL